jgi:hypothetical protein
MEMIIVIVIVTVINNIMATSGSIIHIGVMLEIWKFKTEI